MNTTDVLARLTEAPMEVVGRFMDASNVTLLGRFLDRDPRPIDVIAPAAGGRLGIGDLPTGDLAVVKPRRGEAPLWDFPTGTLHRREVAAWTVSHALGWGLVPETVVRQDAQLGACSVQRYVAHDPDGDYFRLLESGEPDVVDELRAMAVFDAVIDNADRKAGHVLRVTGDEAPPRIRLVDHGVTFHVEPKLRTVAWDFAGDEIPAGLLADLDALAERLTGDLRAVLTTLLTGDEVAALASRTTGLVESGRFPEPTGPRPYPWPLW